MTTKELCRMLMAEDPIGEREVFDENDMPITNIKFESGRYILTTDTEKYAEFDQATLDADWKESKIASGEDVDDDLFPSSLEDDGSANKLPWVTEMPESGGTKVQVVTDNTEEHWYDKMIRTATDEEDDDSAYARNNPFK